MLNKIKKIGETYLARAKQYQELSPDQKAHYEKNELISFNTYLYPAYAKNSAWYALTIILVLGLVAYGLITNAWTFSMVVIIAAGVYYYIHSQENPVISVTVSDIGVRVGSRVYDFAEIATYWIDYNPPYVSDLHLVLKNRRKQDITIQLHEVQPAAMRSILSGYLPEWKEREKNFGESITNILGL